MNDQQTQDAREDTMLYRKPTPDSDDNAVQDIWGEKLEVRTVDQSEVADLLAEGWVTHPLHLEGSEKKQKPEQAAGFEPVKGEALEAAEKLAEALTKERDEAQSACKAAHETATALGKEVEQLKAENAKLAGDLKASEGLIAEETKAKEAAQAELAELRAAKPTLAAKPKGN